MAVYAENQDLINVGAYHTGSNPLIDEAIAKHEAIEQFLMQEVDESSTVRETLALMSMISSSEIPESELPAAEQAESVPPAMPQSVPPDAASTGQETSDTSAIFPF
jgi:flagellum-specific ATP synthase